MANISAYRGFSLVELAVVLTILALVIAGGITLTTAKVEQERTRDSFEEMREISKALGEHVLRYDRLPCPARLDRPRGDAEFGREAADCADASPPSGLTRVEYPASSGTYVRIGGVPFYALRLSDQYFTDDWNGRYLYAVSEEAITAVDTDSVGNITVRDDAGTSIDDEIVWVLVSHGKSRKGAYDGKTGAVTIACSGTDKDGENCDGDGIFIDAQYNDGAVAANFSDDIIRWQNRMRLFALEANEAAPEEEEEEEEEEESSESSIWMELVGVIRGVTVPAVAGMPGGWPDFVICEGADTEYEWLLRNYRYTEGDETVSYKGFGGRDFYWNLADGSYNAHDAPELAGDCGAASGDIADICAAGRCGYYTDASGTSNMEYIANSDGFTVADITPIAKWPDYLACLSSSDSNLTQILFTDRHDDDGGGGDEDIKYRGGNNHGFEYEFYTSNGNYKTKSSSLATNCGTAGNSVIAICTGGRCGHFVEDDVVSVVAALHGYTAPAITGLDDGWPDILLCEGSDSDEEIPLYPTWYDNDYTGSIKVVHYEDADGDYYRFNVATGARHSQSGHQTNCTESAGDIVTLCNNGRCGYLGTAP